MRDLVNERGAIRARRDYKLEHMSIHHLALLLGRTEARGSPNTRAQATATTAPSSREWVRAHAIALQPFEVVAHDADVQTDSFHTPRIFMIIYTSHRSGVMSSDAPLFQSVEVSHEKASRRH